MKIVRNIRLGIKTLLLHKLRSFLTVLGVVFGVGSVISMLAVGEGASVQALKDIRKLGSNNIIISTMKPEEKSNPNGSKRTIMNIYGLKYADQQRIKETMPHIKNIVPVKLINKRGRMKRQLLDVRLVGTSPIWFKVVKRQLLSGRYLTNDDMKKNKNVCVLTENVARKLLGAKAILGEWVWIGKYYFEVVGVTKGDAIQNGGIQSPDRTNDIYVPFNVCKAYYGNMISQHSAGSRSREMIELHQLIIEVDNIENVEAVNEALVTMFSRFHKKPDYHISVPMALLRQAESTQRTFSIVLGSIAAISLLVGGIGIMNIMLASVTERTREIGIRRAIGAKKHQIVVQFLVETVVLSSVGGIIGITVGVSVPWLITHFSTMPTLVTSSSLILSFGISMLVGIVFGIYPAMRAAGLKPIDALRHE